MASTLHCVSRGSPPIAASRSATLLKTPRRMATWVIRAKKRSTKLSQDEEVGMKCRLNRLCRFNQFCTCLGPGSALKGDVKTSRFSEPGTHHLRIVGIALLGPGIGAIVIAVDFPIARLVHAREFDTRKPLGALPEIKMRHDEAQWPAMFARQRLALPMMRQ